MMQIAEGAVSELFLAELKTAPGQPYVIKRMNKLSVINRKQAVCFRQERDFLVKVAKERASHHDYNDGIVALRFGNKERKKEGRKRERKRKTEERRRKRRRKRSKEWQRRLAASCRNSFLLLLLPNPFLLSFFFFFIV